MGTPVVWVRALAVWLLIILAESVHGTLRQLFLAPAIGDLRARQISVFTGTAIIFLITLALVRWIRPPSSRALFGIGALWLVLTISFEVVLGRTLGLDWSRILSDYDPRCGGWMGVGLLALFFMPLLAARIRHVGGAERAG